MSIVGKPITGITGLFAPPWLTVTIRSQATALRTIAKGGVTAGFTRATGQQYDPAVGTMTAGNVAGWFAPLVEEEYAVKEIDGTLIQRGDCKLLLPGIAPLPLVGDTITLRGEAWSVVNVATDRQQGVPVIHTLQARR